MTQNTRLYMTVENEIMEKIDAIVKEVNAEKATWRRPTNRQAVMRGLMKFALDQDIECISGWQRYVTVRFKKKHIRTALAALKDVSAIALSDEMNDQEKITQIWNILQGAEY